MLGRKRATAPTVILDPTAFRSPSVNTSYSAMNWSAAYLKGKNWRGSTKEGSLARAKDRAETARRVVHGKHVQRRRTLPNWAVVAPIDVNFAFQNRVTFGHCHTLPEHVEGSARDV